MIEDDPFFHQSPQEKSSSNEEKEALSSDDQSDDFEIARDLTRSFLSKLSPELSETLITIK